ncbi:purine-uracil permease NCS1-like [Telopea speciosissima]|uniref:purine-uracil permease NCS1-like n=1 Tax=Telopea speciosissima TaxID=54955 RepID=UPI001CC68DF3|nr:purine-uracil permease NCS1-like [Telopea speciosissima]
MVSNCLRLRLNLHPHLAPISADKSQPRNSSILTNHFLTTNLTVSATHYQHHHLHLLHSRRGRRRRCSPPVMASNQDSLYYDRDAAGLANDDLKPMTPEQRTFSGLEMASLWVGLVVGVPTYYLAGSLVDLGMAWWQGIATVVAANVILLVPLILTGHPETRYGISFPALARFAFGIRGAHVPTLLRALVGCGWFGIETWIDGEAVFLLLPSSLKHASFARSLPWLGTSPLEFSCFLVFWMAEMAIIWKGIDGIWEGNENGGNEPTTLLLLPFPICVPYSGSRFRKTIAKLVFDSKEICRGLSQLK